MRFLRGYSDLAPALASGEECSIKGIDWETRFVRQYKVARIVKIHPCPVLRVCTTTYSCVYLPEYKFLINPLPYPFSSVPLKSLLRLKLSEMPMGRPIAVAPIAMVSNNPHHDGGIVSDHVISFSAIRSVSSMDTMTAYDIELADGDNYILNNVVRVL